MTSHSLILYVLAVFLASFAQTLLKLNANKAYIYKKNEFINILVLSAYGLFVISMLLTNLALRSMLYKYSMIMEGLSYISVLVLAKVVLKEKVTAKTWIGNGIIIIGIAIFNI